MQAWAILLGSKNWNKIFCVFATTKQEAFGKAFTELSEQLSTDSNHEKGKVGDYSLIVFVSADSPLGIDSSKPISFPSGSFEDQIQQVRKA